MLQIFKDEVTDELFKNGDFDSILDFYKLHLYEKLSSINNNNFSIYLSYLTGYDSIRLCAFKVNKEVIQYMSIGKNLKKSINVIGVIDNEFGTSKIYTSKKRLECRYKPRALIDNYCIELVLPKKFIHLNDLSMAEIETEIENRLNMYV